MEQLVHEAAERQVGLGEKQKRPFTGSAIISPTLPLHCRDSDTLCVCGVTDIS